MELAGAQLWQVHYVQKNIIIIQKLSTGESRRHTVHTV